MNNPRSNAIVFTACAVNYLPKAVAMCRSVLENDPGLDVAILVVDRKRPLAIDDERISILWAEDAGFPNYLQCAFKYNVIELNTALKPHVAKFLLDRYQKVIYLDPDTYAFGSLRPLLASLERHDVLLSPHALTPHEDDHRPNDVDLLRFGAFNLGFFAARDTPNARALLTWWDKRCQENCFYEPSLGLGVDQKWMDLAPCFFEGVGIVRDPGINVAFWNLHERVISHHDEMGWRINRDHSLIFFHFSSFDELDATAVAGKQTRFEPGSRPDFTSLRNLYASALARSGEAVSVDSDDYGYARMSDGRMISPALRRFYASLLSQRFKEEEDPFDAGGAVYAFAKRNRLFSNQEKPDRHISFKSEGTFNREKSMLDAAFRIVLRTFGPDRYFMLMRYFAHYSSILKQSDILK